MRTLKRYGIQENDMKHLRRQPIINTSPKEEITMKLLRETVRELIKEGLKLNDDLMILNADHTPGLYLLAKASYDLPQFDYSHFYENNLLGMLSLSQTEYECHGAKEVKKAAAIPGYGPTLYDLVMELTLEPLINDRGSVSRDAKNLMSFYKDNRPDVSKKLLDNVDDEIYGEETKEKPYRGATEDTKDNCAPGDYADFRNGLRVFGSHEDSDTWEEDPLAYAYNKPASKRALELELKGDEFIKTYSVGKGTFRSLGSELFNELYD
jgi:hypothetical protein